MKAKKHSKFRQGLLALLVVSVGVVLISAESGVAVP